MRHQIRTHPLRGATGERLLKGGERETGGLDRTERDDRRALPAVAWLGKRDEHGRTVLPDAHTGDSHPVVRLGFGDEILDVAIGHDHQPLARVGVRPNAACLSSRKSRCPDQAWHGTELIGREKARQGGGLNRQRRFQLEHVE